MNKGWSFIKRLIKEAEKQEVTQQEMPAFLKEHFTKVLDTLEDMARGGIDLSDRQVVSNLKNLELALHQIPQRRIYSWDSPIVFEEFEEYVERFYVILSNPKQNAETSFTARWTISRFESFLFEREDLDNSLSSLEEDILEEKEILDCLESNSSKSEAKVKKVLLSIGGQDKEGIDELVKQTKKLATNPIRKIKTRLKELEEKKKTIEDRKEKKIQYFIGHLNTYLAVCKNLDTNGSDMLRALMVTVAEDVANALYSEFRWKESGLVWVYVISLLSQDNIRIVQREGRLELAKSIKKMVE